MVRRPVGPMSLGQAQPSLSKIQTIGAPMETIETETIDALRQRHAELEAMLRAEYGRARPDDMALKRLKLEKLYVKERLDGRLLH